MLSWILRRMHRDEAGFTIIEAFIAMAIVAVLACARLGAVHSVVFGGFAANELAVRIDDANVSGRHGEIRMHPDGLVYLDLGSTNGSFVRREPQIEWPDEATAARMTTTEQIVWAHRVNKDTDVEPGATLRLYADLLPASDGTAPFAIHTFNQITGGAVIMAAQTFIRRTQSSGTRR